MTSWIQIPKGRLYPKDLTSIPITKSIQDLRDLSSRKGGFSKTVTIAGTAEANELLGYYFNVNLEEASFDHKVKVPAQIVQDGVVVMEGVLRLLSISKESPSALTLDEVVNYDVQVLDESSTFFVDLEDLNLRDLDLSFLSHQLTAQEVIASADHTQVDGYKYLWSTPVDNGTDQYYPIDHLKPGIYAKTYWDLIFSSIGYRYQWDDLEDYNFHKLILPYTGGKLQPTEDDATLIRATYQSDGLVLDREYDPSPIFGITGPNGQQNIQPVHVPVDEIISDQFGFLSPTGTYTLPILQDIGEFSAYYDIQYRFKIINLSLDSTTKPLVIKQTARFGGLEEELKIKPLLRLSRNGIPIQATGFNNSNIPDESFAGDTVVIPAGISTLTLPTRSIRGFLPSNEIPYVGGISSNFRFEIGGYVGVATGNATVFFGESLDPLDTTSVPVKIELEVLGAEISFTPTVNSIGDGMIINMNKVVPDISQREFIRGIMTHFNLMLGIPEEDDPFLVKFIGRDKFYDLGKERNWTDKLVMDRELQVSFTGEETGKRKILSWKPGNDILNVDYTLETKAVFGQQGFRFSDDFARGESFITVPWEPTIIIKNSFGQYVHGLNGAEPRTGPRLVYDGGKKTSLEYPILRYGALPDNWRTGNNPNVVRASVYTYSGHFNDPIQPDWDLNFGPASFYGYENWLSITNNNQYTLHWARTFQQLEEGKILEGWFWLTPNDFTDFELNDRIWLWDSWWNVLEIRDYDANSSNPVWVKLITIDPNQLFNVPFTFDGTIAPPNLNPSPSVTTIDPVNPFTPVRSPRLRAIRDVYDGVVDSTNVIETTGPVIVVGPGNVVRDEGGPLVVIGGDNVINNPGPTLMIGEGVTTSPVDNGPNIYVGGGTYIDETGVHDRRIKIVDGGLDEVLRHFKFNDQDVIDPGEDVIKFYGGVNPQRHVFENGIDDVRWTWNPQQ